MLQKIPICDFFLFTTTHRMLVVGSTFIHTPRSTPYGTTPIKTQIARCDHDDPPTDHSIVRNYPHRRAITFKPFSFSYQHPYASTDALAAPIPLSFQRPAPTTITDAQIHHFHLCNLGEAISPLIQTEPLPLPLE